MKLKDVILGIHIVSTHNLINETDILSICFDSRKCSKGSLFVAIKGTQSDGHDYILKAIENGATAIICQTMPKEKGNITYIQTDDSHQSLGIIASNFYNQPSEAIKLVGITGTNGKTTTVTLLYNLFSKLGYSCGLISTITYKIGNKEFQSTHTTPDPISLNLLLSQMVDAGCEYCFMEVSSHSIDQNRIAGLKFIGGIFSNITHDHLDYHKTFRDYVWCKKRFFDNLSVDAFALTNIDDKNGEIMLQNCKANKYTYSCNRGADFKCRVIEKGLDGMLLNFDSREFWTSFIGLHNAYNLLAVYATATLLGADKEEVLVALSSLGAVSGRLEYIKGGNNLTAFVDYAHTPDALENVLHTLKDSAGDSKIITIFGCGGDRDKSKRPKMAAIAALMSDRVFVTNDNPRFEDPIAIIEDIKNGFTKEDFKKTLIIPDRAEAIKSAIITAPDNSIILVAGKGHENYQDIKGTKIHFDDKEVIKQIFKEI